MQDTSGSTEGGAATFTTKVFFTDLTSAVIPSVVSSSASDTATTLAISSLTSAGVLQSETVTLAGTTVTAATLTAANLMKAVQGGTAQIGDIAVLGNKVISSHTMQAGTTNGCTLQSGDGASVAVGDIIRVLNNTPSGVQFQLRSILSISTDTVVVSRAWSTTPSSSTTYDVWTGMQFDLSPTKVTQVRRIFYGAYANAAGGSSNTWYCKIFAANTNTTTTAILASILKQADPVNLYTNGGSLNFALTNALNDTATISTNLNPGTPPSSITSYSSGAAPQTVAVPSPQNLPAGAAPNAAGAQGIWLQLVLPGGTSTVQSFADFRITAQTS